MSLQTEARAVLGQILTLYPEGKVVVSYEGKSADAIGGTGTSSSSLGEAGDRGRLVKTVRVNASSLTRPDDGATIVVDGVSCTVVETRLDPTGAILAIMYLVGRPVT